MTWVVFVTLILFATALPPCWLLSNRVCRCVPTRYRHIVRRAVRAYLGASFLSLWAVTAAFDAIDWQLPLYAALPLVLGLDRKRVTGCALLSDVGCALVAALTALLITTVVWSSRASPIGQGVLFCAIQPPVSAVAMVLQTRLPSAQAAHLLEWIVVLRALASGAFVSDTYTVWRESIYAFVAFVLGTCAITLLVLFVAPRWACVCSPQDADRGEAAPAADAAGDPPTADIVLDEGSDDDATEPSETPTRRSTETPTRRSTPAETPTRRSTETPTRAAPPTDVKRDVKRDDNVASRVSERLSLPTLTRNVFLPTEPPEKASADGAKTAGPRKTLTRDEARKSREELKRRERRR